jgi:hypothetical protein
MTGFFNPDGICDKCGRRGSYEFYCEGLCLECYRNIGAGPGFEPVPPPHEAPRYPEAEKLGLLRGLRAEKVSPYRCAHCNRMQRAGWIVQVPDGVCMSDPEWSVIDQARRNAHNGYFSGWCLRCALKLGKPSVLRWLFGVE